MDGRKKVIASGGSEHNELRSRRNANEEETITVDDVFKRYFIYLQRLRNIISIKRDA